MEISGKIVKILDTQRFTSQRNGNEYVKNTFVIETQGNYPKRIAFSVMGEDKFTQMGIVVGGTYNVSFDVESREWQGKWFTECSAWRVQRIDGDAVQGEQQKQQQVQQQVQQPTTKEQPQVSKVAESNNDLPF